MRGHCCAAPPAATPVPATVGDLRIDPGQRRVWRGEDERTLTAREFEVLEFLVPHPGQDLVLGQDLTGAADQDFQGDPNIVEVYVRRLRRKLDEPYGHRSIQTVRGAGYRLADDGR